MKQQTRIEIKRLIKLLNITKTDDEKIERIANDFPGHYSNEQEYIEFQMKIADIVEEMHDCSVDVDYKITHIQLYDFAVPQQIDDEGNFEIVFSYSANLVINDEFIVQVSGDDDEATFHPVTASNEIFWNKEENQDKACEEVDDSELREAIEATDFENNWEWLNENAEIMNAEENKSHNQR